jgi:hypothetical protein
MLKASDLDPRSYAVMIWISDRFALTPCRLTVRVSFLTAVAGAESFLTLLPRLLVVRKHGGTECSELVLIS